MQECDRMEALVTEVQATTKLAIRSRTGSEFVHCGMRFGPHLGCYPTHECVECPSSYPGARVARAAGRVHARWRAAAGKGHSRGLEHCCPYFESSIGAPVDEGADTLVGALQRGLVPASWTELAWPSAGPQPLGRWRASRG